MRMSYSQAVKASSASSSSSAGSASKAPAEAPTTPHAAMHWSACFNDRYDVHLRDKEGANWFHKAASTKPTAPTSEKGPLGWASGPRQQIRPPGEVRRGTSRKNGEDGERDGRPPGREPELQEKMCGGRGVGKKGRNRGPTTGIRQRRTQDPSSTSNEPSGTPGERAGPRQRILGGGGTSPSPWNERIPRLRGQKGRKRLQRYIGLKRTRRRPANEKLVDKYLKCLFSLCLEFETYVNVLCLCLCFWKSIVRPMRRGRGANVTNSDLANLFSHD